MARKTESSEESEPTALPGEINHSLGVPVSLFAFQVPDSDLPVFMFEVDVNGKTYRSDPIAGPADLNEARAALLSAAKAVIAGSVNTGG